MFQTQSADAPLPAEQTGPDHLPPATSVLYAISSKSIHCELSSGQAVPWPLDKRR